MQKLLGHYKYVVRAQIAGLDWVRVSTLDEAQIATQLCPAPAMVRGERAAIDLPWVHRELRRAHIFVAVLGASNYTYACATAGKNTRGSVHRWLGARRASSVDVFRAT